MTDLDTYDDPYGVTMGVDDITAEQGVLGSMLLDNTLIADMSALLRADDFYRVKHGEMFTLIVDMYGSGQPVDQITVVSALIENGEISRMGGAPFVALLCEYARPEAVRTYAQAVADRATNRNLAALGAQAAQLAAQPGAVAAKVAMVRELADGLNAHREVAAGQWVGDVTVDAIQAIEDAGSDAQRDRLIPTGYRDLDRMLGGGLRPGSLTIWAARPGIGKSTALLDVHRHVSLHRAVPSAMISLEMPTSEIMQRLLAAETGVPLHLIRTGAVREDEGRKLLARVPDIVDKPLMFVDAPGASMSFVRAEGRRMVRRDGIRLLSIDYLQLMATPPGSESRQQAVADFSRGLKLFSRENDIPVMAAAQLNRNPEQRRDKTPGLSDLRESGAIEQDADVVILIHDPTGGDPSHARVGEVDFIVAKHRGGPTGTVTVANQQDRARFANIAIV